MKKVKVIIIISIILLCEATIVYAANAQVKFKGADEVKAGEKNVITIEISNDEAIGVIEGFISYDSGIEELKVSSSYNGWTTTYNEDTKKFNSFKAEGTTNEEIIEITYKLSENASNGTITLGDIELTTISYNTINIEDNVTKTINKADIKSATSTNTEGGVTITGKDSTKNAMSTEKYTDNSVAETNIPKTGNLLFITIILIIVMIIVAIILYKKNLEYKEIK